MNITFFWYNGRTTLQQPQKLIGRVTSLPSLTNRNRDQGNGQWNLASFGQYCCQLFQVSSPWPFIIGSIHSLNFKSSWPCFCIPSPFWSVSYWLTPTRASQVALVVKNPPGKDLREAGSIPGSGRSPGRGHGTAPQYSCLENPMDRGAWWATVHRATKSQTQLRWLNTHAHNPNKQGDVWKADSEERRRNCVPSATPVVPRFFGNRDRFHGRQLFHRLGWRGDGFWMTQVCYIYCAFYFHYD